MKALLLSKEGLRVRDDTPDPIRPPGSALIRVRLAGICRTDLELVQGYMGFEGVLGHEFVGEVIETDNASWRTKRVVGEINAACGVCSWCRQGLQRHCPHRTVLGILNHDGCMAEYCVLPEENLLEVPGELADEQAVFTEPLSAAYEILEQVPIESSDRCVVLGDGKLGILCAWVLTTVSDHVTLLGRHPEKLERAAWGSLHVTHEREQAGKEADVVVDATGRGAGFADAMALCRPRGTLVLKSTVAAQGDINLAPLVINEITVVGSRCGRFEAGLPGLLEHAFPVERLIDATYDLPDALDAFEHAARPGVLKVLLRTD